MKIKVSNSVICGEEEEKEEKEEEDDDDDDDDDGEFSKFVYVVFACVFSYYKHTVS